MKNRRLKIAIVAFALVILVGVFVAYRDASIEHTSTVSGGEDGHFLSQPVEGEQGGILASIKNTFKGKNRAIDPMVMIPLFTDNFSLVKNLEEAGSVLASSDKGWWLNSGGWVYMNNGTAKTIQGDLAKSDVWFGRYLKANLIDTDNGLHPQNIFRLVQRNGWQNFSQESYFKINKMNLSVSPNRNASNGLLLFNRYQDGDSLYYAGVRVDGFAVVKKKIKGVYYTMALKQIFPGKYDRVANPNLLPVGKWIGLKSEVKTELNGTVRIKLYTDIGKTGVWTLALETVDDGKAYGGASILNAGYAGIRTDFMDVEFDDYRIGVL